MPFENPDKGFLFSTLPLPVTDTSLYHKRMEKEKRLHYIFAAIVILIVAYYGVRLILSFFLSEPAAPDVRRSILTDAVTGERIPDEAVARMSQKQAKERIVYVLTGTVLKKLDNSLLLERATDGGTRSFSVTFSPKTVFLKEFSRAETNPSATEEKEISFAEVNAGDVVTMVFPKGANLDELNTSGTVKADNLIINLPRKTNAAE